MKTILLSLCFISFAEASDLKVSDLINKSLDISKAAETSKISSNRRWKFDKLRIRVRGKVGVEVPFLASLEIKTFVEPHLK